MITTIIILFILWTIFGSFGWVLISREWDKEWIKSIFLWRSRCDKCKKTLNAIELIPIISFFAQKWKCKNCGTKLSNFYWIIELICWIVFVLTYLLVPYWNLFELWFWLIVNWGLLFLIINDIMKYELHTPFWIFTTIVALIYWIIKFSWTPLLLCAIFVSIFLCIYFFAKFYVKIRYKKSWEWFGVWDVYLSATIWLLAVRIFSYNWIEILSRNIIAIILSFVIWSCVLWLIYTLVERITSNRKDIKIPFLPAMIICFWILILFGKYFITLY